MPSILDPLVDKAAGVRKGTRWYQQAIASIADKISARRLMTQGKLNGRPSVGRLNMFFYDPKYKKTLPYYDTFPLIMPLQAAKGGFYGLNFHYLPFAQRVKFLRQLSKYASDKNFDRNTRYNLTGGIENNRYFKLCIKHYLFNHVRSSFLNIPANEMAIGIFLPVARFKGGTFGNR